MTTLIRQEAEEVVGDVLEELEELRGGLQAERPTAEGNG
jgi:hypothetical protein